MVSGSKIEGGAQVLSAGVRRTIQSIKEIVGNHSDADIYVALKETNMDPNETTQRLLNQDPFHEVKRKRDKRKENSGYKSSIAAEPRKNTDLARMPLKYNAHSDGNARRGGFGRNAGSDAGSNREFRVVRDNRLNQNYSSDSKPAPISTSTGEGVTINGSIKSDSTETSGHQKLPIGQHPSQALNGPAVSQPRQSKDASSAGNDRKEMLGEKRHRTQSTAYRVQTKTNVPQPHSANSSSSSVVGVYSSSSDPIHVPSLHSRPAANVGAIRREVGVVGPRRLSSENSTKPSSPQSSSLPKPSSSQSTSLPKPSSSQTTSLPKPSSSQTTPLPKPSSSQITSLPKPSSSQTTSLPKPSSLQTTSLPKSSSSQTTSLPNTQSVQDGHSRGGRPFGGLSKTKSDRSSHNLAPESAIPAPPASRSFASNQHGSRYHQVMGHQKVSQPNKVWKPKSSVKPSASGPGIIGSPAKTVSPPVDSPDLTKEAAEMQDSMSRLNVENQNVIIAAHIRVSETDRSRLTFGSLGAELDSSMNLIYTNAETAEELSTEPPRSVSVATPEPSGNEPAPSKQLEMMDDSVRSSGSISPASATEFDQQPFEKKEASSLKNLDNYADVGLVQDNSPSYTPESLQKKDASELPSFSGYDPQTGYDVSYFRPIVDETVRGLGLSASQDVHSADTANSIPASIAMVQQQQQQQLAQMYPHLHVSHFANIMPYRQFLSPVYVPQMPVPGYSNSPAYPHPSNGSSYLLMPGNGVKYAIQQFKTVPSGNQTGFGNFTSPAVHDDSSRLKYKDSVYLPNPQAETSEIWMNQRDHPGLQSASYYNMPGQTPHPAYLTSHGGHASFNTAAVAQSSHMQFSGMYHPSPQPAAIPSHHLGPAIGGNVGVGSSGPQVGAYQQPQLGHLNWNENF